MSKFLIGIFIVLHGLVHLWYVTLSQRLVEFQPEMGWTGRSWVLTNPLGDGTTRSLASALFVLVTITYVVGGAGVLIQQDWWRPVVIGSALLSSAFILLFWDGQLQMLVEKGVLGLAINVVLLVALLVLEQPAFAF
jgi:hypothetical protein